MTGLAIYDLRFNQCRYPVTPNDARRHLFCGEPVEYEGCPYCPTHAEICFDRRTEEQKRRAAEEAERRFNGIAKKARDAALPPSARPSRAPKF